MRRWLMAALAALMCVCFAVPSLGETSTAQVIRLAYDDDAQTAALTELAEAYMKTHAKVTVQLVLIAESSYYTRLESMAMGSVLPDVFMIHPNRVMDFVSAGALMDLSKARIDVSRYPQAMTDLYRYNGVLYAVPKDVDGVALAYNKALFSAAGVALPDMTWDWHKLREAALELTDAEQGWWGFGAPNDGPGGYYNLVYQNGGYIWKDGQSGYNLPETQEAVQFWVDFVLRDRVSPTAAYYPDIQPDEWMISGEVAMQFVRASQVANLDAASTLRDNFDVIILPTLKRRATICEGAAFAAAANTRNAAAVLEFMGYLGTVDAARLLAAGGGGLMAADSGARAGFGDGVPGVTMKVFEDMMEYAVALPVSPMRSVWAGLERAALESVYAGEASVEDALNALHQQIMALESE